MKYTYPHENFTNESTKKLSPNYRTYLINMNLPYKMMKGGKVSQNIKGLTAYSSHFYKIKFTDFYKTIQKTTCTPMQLEFQYTIINILRNVDCTISLKVSLIMSRHSIMISKAPV